MLEAVLVCTSTPPTPSWTRGFCDCSRMTCSWTLAWHRGSSSTAEDLMQPACLEYTEKISLKQYCGRNCRRQIRLHAYRVHAYRVGYVQNTGASVGFCLFLMRVCQSQPNRYNVWLERVGIGLNRIVCLVWVKLTATSFVAIASSGVEQSAAVSCWGVSLQETG